MWEMRNPVYGNQIRVDRGLYFHHGIYESDDKVYHFAAPEGVETNPENARVLCTSLKEFLKGGNVEVRTYTSEEEQKKKSADEIIRYAKAHLGEGGYNIISNNCEHFSNRCAFGVSSSGQVDQILAMCARLFQ